MSIGGSDRQGILRPVRHRSLYRGLVGRLDDFDPSVIVLGFPARYSSL